jgi:hypothetical protein
MKKILKNIIVFSAMVLIMAPVLTLTTHTATAAIDAWGTNTGAGNVGTITGLGATDPRAIAANAIKIILGFLGIIAVVMILIGGFKYMTASGNTEKTEEAIGIITAAAIGLVIILAAYGIATFVINSVLTSTGGA